MSLRLTACTVLALAAQALAVLCFLYRLDVVGVLLCVLAVMCSGIVYYAAWGKQYKALMVSMWREMPGREPKRSDERIPS